MKRFYSLFIALVAVCAPAIAYFPLDLVQTIQLPANTAWDVQHWMSDSTYGWACVSGTTVHWVTELGTAMQNFNLPLNAQYNLPYTSVSHIRLLHTSAGGNSPLVVVVAVMEESPEITSLFLNVYNLSSHAVLQELELASDVHFPDEDQNTQVSDLVIWPPPPASGQITWRTSYTSFYDHNGTCMYTDRRTDRVHVRPFAVFDRQSFASGEYHLSWREESDPPPCPPWFWTMTQRISVDSLGLNLCINGQPCNDSAAVIAQVDANGTRRVIIPGGYAFDAIMFTQLWHNPTPTFLFSAKLSGSADERLLSYDTTSHGMDVFEAAGGTFMSETDPILGSPICTLKHPAGPDEVVTLDGTTVRIYSVAGPRDVTVEYFPPVPHYPFSIPAHIDLHWSPVVTPNVRYDIYSDTLVNGSFSTFVTSTADTHCWRDLTIDWRLFYVVRAVTP